ncbi:MAG: hypothetical protein Q7U10_10645 [Thermodesulfovibrionia bacterium]|nr:hypothetical protein [Thermodesulfovibrionia bacterium]
MTITASRKMMIFFLAFLFIAVSCATTGKRSELEEMVQPHRSYEACFELKKGEALEYSFTSSRPLDFNIHYHAIDGLHYPVNEKNIRSRKGTLVCDEQKYYTEDQEAFCMMWENHEDAFISLKLQYGITGRE